MNKKGDKTDTMTHKGDKTRNKERMKGDKADTVTKGHSDQQEVEHDNQEGRPRETSRTEGGHAVRQPRALLESI